MKKHTIPALLALVLVAASAALLAAPRATLILRNGDQIRCELLDLGGVDYTFQTTSGEQKLPINDVAFIDFVGGAIPPAEVAKMQDGRPFIALRNGDIIAGRLVDIGGNDPKILRIRMTDGTQDFSSNDVARIFLFRWEGMPTPAQSTDNRSRSSRGRSGGEAQLQQGGAGMPVPASQCWTNTGIYVDRGQYVAFNGSGEIQLSNDPDDVATVSGSKTGRFVPNAPIPSVPAGALIGRVGNARPFGIGDQRQRLAMPDAGDLWLGINDDRCGDNRGEFRVEINARRR